MTVVLRRAEADQLLSYLEHRDRTGWYYGNRHQFEMRHIVLKTKLEAVLEELNGTEKASSKETTTKPARGDGGHLDQGGQLA